MSFHQEVWTVDVVMVELIGWSEALGKDHVYREERRGEERRGEETRDTLKEQRKDEGDKGNHMML
jgi:hypothetical protein